MDLPKSKEVIPTSGTGFTVMLATINIEQQSSNPNQMLVLMLLDDGLNALEQS